jgi:hypothetical protein
VTRRLSLFLLLLSICCNSEKEEAHTFTAKALNLNGKIKHLTENSGNAIWDIEFVDNRVSTVYRNSVGQNDETPYIFEYRDSVLKRITEGGQVTPLEDFEFYFNLRFPLWGFQDADTLERNNNGDVVRVVLHDSSMYRIKYIYDSLGNWITRKVYRGDSEDPEYPDQPREQTERTILYSYVVTPEELLTWNRELDSIYSVAKLLTEPVASIDTTIQNDRNKMKTLNKLVNNKYHEVAAMETRVDTLIQKFNVQYGYSDLLPSLQRIRTKLYLLSAMTQAQRILWHEAQIYLPWLISGEKTVHSLQEPFANRYLLTLTEELIVLINRHEKGYDDFNAHPLLTETEIARPESKVTFELK